MRLNSHILQRATYCCNTLLTFYLKFYRSLNEQKLDHYEFADAFFPYEHEEQLISSPESFFEQQTLGMNLYRQFSFIFQRGHNLP